MYMLKSTHFIYSRHEDNMCALSTCFSDSGAQEERGEMSEAAGLVVLLTALRFLWARISAAL